MNFVSFFTFIPNIKDNIGVLEKEKTTEYEQVENKNGSISFKIKGTANCLTSSDNGLIITERDEKNENQQFYLEKFDSKKYMETETKYSRDGKYLEETIDHLGKVTKYTTHLYSGLLLNTTDPKGNITDYTYDTKRKLTKVSKNGKSINYTYNTNELLSKISCNNKEYNFTYDNFSNSKEVKIKLLF